MSEIALKQVNNYLELRGVRIIPCNDVEMSFAVRQENGDLHISPERYEQFKKADKIELRALLAETYVTK